MLEVKGKVQNGAVFPLEPINDSYEGKGWCRKFYAELKEGCETVI
jgi:hypothetical protein